MFVGLGLVFGIEQRVIFLGEGLLQEEVMVNWYSWNFELFLYT